MLARGVEQTLRLLLAGVIVGVVLNAVTDLVTLRAPDILRGMQGLPARQHGLARLVQRRRDQPAPRCSLAIAAS